jgi:hypothetical protein
MPAAGEPTKVHEIDPPGPRLRLGDKTTYMQCGVSKLVVEAARGREAEIVSVSAIMRWTLSDAIRVRIWVFEKMRGCGVVGWDDLSLDRTLEPSAACKADA